MYKQRLFHHAIADNAAIAATVERKNIGREHACDVRCGVNADSHSVSKRAVDGNLQIPAKLTEGGDRPPTGLLALRYRPFNW